MTSNTVIYKPNETLNRLTHHREAGTHFSAINGRSIQQPTGQHLVYFTSRCHKFYSFSFIWEHTHTHHRCAYFLVPNHNYISLLSAFIYLVMLERSVAFSIWSMCPCTKTPQKMYLLENRSQWLATWGQFVITTTCCHYCAKHLFMCYMKEIWLKWHILEWQRIAYTIYFATLVMMKPANTF